MGNNFFHIYDDENNHGFLIKPSLWKITLPDGHYSREGGFMDYISKFVKEKYQISKKDSWNPADIWLIKSGSDFTKIKEKFYIQLRKRC